MTKKIKVERVIEVPEGDFCNLNRGINGNYACGNLIADSGYCTAYAAWLAGTSFRALKCDQCKNAEDFPSTGELVYINTGKSCSNCFEHIGEGFNFCPECGRKLGED